MGCCIQGGVSIRSIYKTYYTSLSGRPLKTTVEYGQIFHVMSIGKHYCKNVKYKKSNLLHTK